jgi:hypothetical protein
MPSRCFLPPLLAGLLLAGLPAAAHAQPSTVRPIGPAPGATYTAETDRYYSHTLVADGLGLALFLGGFAAEGDGGEDTDASGALFGLGMVGSMFASPIIHLTKGNVPGAGQSLLLRVTLPSLAGWFAVATADCEDEGFLDLCELDYLGPGVAAGFAITALLDATFIAKRDIVVERRAWSPQLSVTRERTTVGFATTW